GQSSRSPRTSQLRAFARTLCAPRIRAISRYAALRQFLRRTGTRLSRFESQSLPGVAVQLANRPVRFSLEAFSRPRSPTRVGPEYLKEIPIEVERPDPRV